MATDLHIEALRARGVHSDTLALDEGGTIVGPERTAALAAATFAEATVSGASDAMIQWPLPIQEGGEILGRGGMGEVRSAVQIGLEREVAIKTLHAEADTPVHREALYREAWVMGQLQHPHIIPVHAVGGDEEGRLAIVMKRVEGEPWADLLGAGSGSPLFDGVEPLEFHLRVLERVCQAAHFAHSRGILHRDIKPENVMLGIYGEVYLVDWGLAVTLPSAPPGPLLAARKVCLIQGTPGYLAPEMALGDGAQISERTDVFLLGATLHRILTGEERWEGQSVMQKVAKALECLPPEYGPEVPGELAAIAARAMADRPEGRWPSADALRRAIADYRAHAAALKVTERALDRFEELRRELSLETPDLGRVAELAAESRFGFQLAMEQWPDGPQAKQALEALGERMAEHELSMENPNGAEVWLRLLPEPPAALRARLDALRETLAARRAARLRLERERDPRIGARTRGRMTVLLVLFISAYSAGAQIWASVTGDTPGHGPLALFFGIYALGLLVPISRVWKKMPQAARAQAAFVVFSSASLFAMPIAGALVGASLWQTTVFAYVVTALYAAALAGISTPRMLVPFGIYLLGAAGAYFLPDLIWANFGSVGALATAMVGWAWWSAARGRRTSDAENSGADKMSPA